jgi:actin-related protein
MVEDHLKPLIIDIGTASFRLGFAGEGFPIIKVPTIYADITDPLFKSDIIAGFEELFITESMDQLLFGTEALKYKDILKIHDFYKEKNFPVLNNFFLYYYYQLGIPDEFLFQQPIIVLVPFFTSEGVKVKLQNLFLNELHFPSINFVNFSECILASLGKKTGVVINLGEESSFVSTIYHGFSNITAREFFPIAGKDLTDYFMDLILFNKKHKVSYIDRWIAREIKEKTAICVLNPKEIKHKIKEGLDSYDQEIRLPDGNSFTINLERFMIVEPLFNPSLIHIDVRDLPQLVADLIKS